MYYLSVIPVDYPAIYNFTLYANATISLWMDGIEQNLINLTEGQDITKYTLDIWLTRGLHGLLIKVFEENQSIIDDENYFVLNVSNSKGYEICPVTLRHGRYTLIYFDPRYLQDDELFDGSHSYYESRFVVKQHALQSMTLGSMTTGLTMIAGAEYMWMEYMLRDIFTASWGEITDVPFTPMTTNEQGHVIFSSDIMPDVMARPLSSKYSEIQNEAIDVWYDDSVLENFLEAFGTVYMSGNKPLFCISHKTNPTDYYDGSAIVFDIDDDDPEKSIFYQNQDQYANQTIDVGYHEFSKHDLLASTHVDGSKIGYDIDAEDSYNYGLYIKPQGTLGAMKYAVDFL